MMAEGHRILLVDGAVKQLKRIRRGLAGAGYRVFAAASSPEAATFLQENAADLVIFDPSVSPDDGPRFVRYVCERHADTAVIVTTGEPSIDGAVAAIKAGADAYLDKSAPFEDLLAAVRESLRKVERRRLVGSGSVVEGAGTRWDLIGDSSVMQDLYVQIEPTGRSDATVLIHGETGTGKELLARAIHQESSRSSKPFLPVNCAALPEGMLESELFGHVRGAFTGAERTRRGMFRAADGGTLFLDEVGEMSPRLQGKLLRVLEDGVVPPIGTTKDYRVDVRVVVATHRDLAQLVAENRFREDLYFRLKVLSMEIPPLRKRGEDILLLAHHFLRKYAGEAGPPRFSDEVNERLLTYPWPGNVRELANVMQNLAVRFAGKTIGVADLPEEMLEAAPRVNRTRLTLREAEDEHIRLVYAACDGNQSRTADVLGISRGKLIRRLRALGLIG